MQTRAQAHGTRQPSTEMQEPSVRPNPRRRQQMIHQSILNMERQIVALEGKELLTESHRQTALRISKMLESMCSEFQAYHYEIVDNIETDEDAALEQLVFDEHQSKAMEFIDRLGDLLVKPSPRFHLPCLAITA